MRKTIFCNIGWMKYYQGITAEDDIKGGGSFSAKHNYGHEIFNFLPVNGQMYGYVQPGGEGTERNIDIKKRLGASNRDSVDDVLSVWVAKNPDKDGTWVIGWYENSTVYRRYQQAPPNSNRIFDGINLGYRVTAKVEHCVCLPVEERTLKFPRDNKVKGYMGQANIWYADSQEKAIVEFRQEVENFIQKYRNSEIKQLDIIRQKLDKENLDPNDLEDARERVLTSIVRRQGQSQFRQNLLTAYKGRCTISSCNVEPALEAAHIIPYLGLHTNTTSNGLLLRADLHTLFDLKLITIHPESMKVLVAPELRKTQYGEFFEQTITLPKNEADIPSEQAIKEHYAQCKWRNEI